MSDGNSPRHTRGGRGGRILARFLAYQIASWSVLGVVTRDLGWGAPVAVAVVALYTTIPLLLFVKWRGWPFYPGAAFRVFVVRAVLYSQLVLPFAAAAAVLGMLIGIPFSHSLLFGRLASGGVVGATALLLIAGYFGSRRLVLREVDASVPELPAAFDGIRIAQISDLHVGPQTSRRFLARVAAAVGRATPDIIAVTGDVVDDRAEDVPWYAAAFATLEAPLGVYIIPGNHDIYAGWDAVARSLRQRTKATILVNDARVVERRGARLAIVGTGDPAAGPRAIGLPNDNAAPDVDRALASVPAGTTTIAFAHNPALWPGLARRGVSLTLSGHTHWGQFALPRLGWSLASPFLEHAMGGHRAGDALLYINPGTGYWGIPFRLGAFPEITIVRLRRADEAGLSIGAAKLAA
ncbi:MAG TPA: metallophosphoesterase [Gemmatimonadaceae bacterium]|nr:metallophosphoesterase [Gemmatimonadaceae bacterium]